MGVVIAVAWEMLLTFSENYQQSKSLWGRSLSKCYLIICGIYIKVDETTNIGEAPESVQNGTADDENTT